MRIVSDRTHRISQQRVYLEYIVEINDRHDAIGGLYTFGHFVRDHPPVDVRLSPTLVMPPHSD